MKIILLGGFLGSGKTSVLMQLARYIVDKNKDKSKTPLVIIENEIGEVSVDGKMLGNFELRELFSGCICCSLAGDLTITIHQIREKLDPEYIIIESTGLALPDKIAQTIADYTEDCTVKTVTIADASRWEEIMEYTDIFFTKQMQCGQIMLLNKTDLVDEETKQAILAELKSLNPSADTYCICANGPMEDVIEKLI